MFLTEYDEEKTLQQTKQEGFDEGKVEGKVEGIDEANRRMATNMLQDRKPLAEILKYSTLSENIVRSIAAQRGFAIV